LKNRNDIEPDIVKLRWDEWISVDDKIPEYGTSFIALYEDGNMSIPFFFAESWDNFRYCGKVRILFWKPLPSKPSNWEEKSDKAFEESKKYWESVFEPPGEHKKKIEMLFRELYQNIRRP
jgi:hypothetical protein